MVIPSKKLARNLTAINQDVNPTSFFYNKKRITMNEVSIIINGVRYDAVIEPSNAVFYDCTDCDLLTMCKAHCNFNLCEYLGINFGFCFKKSDKKFER